MCVLSTVHRPSDVRIFYRECKTLVRNGYKVCFVVPHDADEAVDGVWIKALPKPKGRLGRITKTAWQAYREAVRRCADVYHFHDPELIPVGLMLRVRGRKVVYDIHEDLPRQILAKPYLPVPVRRLASWVSERVENFSCHRFSALVAATPAIARRFEKLHAGAWVVQNFPVCGELDAGRRLPWSLRARAVAYVGTISLNRGIVEMVKAMGFLSAELPTTLKLAGEFFPDNLPRELAALPGWSRVENLGYLDRDGVAHVLGQVRAGLVLIHPEPRYQVAYPVKMFEYMAAGIPVIASDFPLWRKIVEEADCGLLVDPLSPQAIADAIAYLLAHPEEAEAMGSRGRNAVERKYNWSQEEVKLLECYRNLLDGGPAA